MEIVNTMHYMRLKKKIGCSLTSVLLSFFSNFWSDNVLDFSACVIASISVMAGTFDLGSSWFWNIAFPSQSIFSYTRLLLLRFLETTIKACWLIICYQRKFEATFVNWSFLQNFCLTVLDNILWSWRYWTPLILDTTGLRAVCPTVVGL